MFAKSITRSYSAKGLLGWFLGYQQLPATPGAVIGGIATGTVVGSEMTASVFNSIELATVSGDYVVVARN